MNTFTYTPTAERAVGIAHANAQAKKAHDAAQLPRPAGERVAYAVTDEDYAHAALDRVADNYVAQKKEAELVKNRQLLADAIQYLTAEQKAEIVAQVAAAKHKA